MTAAAITRKLYDMIALFEKDPGLAGISKHHKEEGLEGAHTVADVLGVLLDRLKLNDDGVITPDDIRKASDALRADYYLYGKYIVAHGYDAGGHATGFHNIRGDGGTLKFKGRDFVDTVADTILQIGLHINGDHFINRDGSRNEDLDDTAGWFNYFLNGKSMVFGTKGNDELGSGAYSKVLALAANETFEAGDGNDKIWAGNGADTVLAGSGNDTSGGGAGNDKMYGGVGLDQLWGDTGSDRIYGNAGADKLGGGAGEDIMMGGNGSDYIYGDIGNDTIDGGTGDDDIFGGEGNNLMHGADGDDDIHGSIGKDRLFGDAGDDCLMADKGADRMDGGSGHDELSGGEGRDTFRGGAGADELQMWDQDNAMDTLVFAKGDSGRTRKSIDIVEGFQSGEDKIDLRALGNLIFEDLDYVGGGEASVYYDGRYLRIDLDGDRASDMIVEFMWVNELKAADFILA